MKVNYFNFILFIPILHVYVFALTACSAKKTEDTALKDSVDVLKIWNSPKKKQQVYTLDALFLHQIDTTFFHFDTVSSYAQYSFSEIERKTYLNLVIKRISTQIPHADFNEIVAEKDSCLYIQLENQQIDTLCNKLEGENLIRYSIAAFWPSKKQLFVDRSDWEGNERYSIHTKSGLWFSLLENNIHSPTLDHIITYSNSLNSPLYSDGFDIVNTQSDSMILEMSFPFRRLCVLDVHWVDTAQAIFELGMIDSTDHSIAAKSYGLLVIKALNR